MTSTLLKLDLRENKLKALFEAQSSTLENEEKTPYNIIYEQLLHGDIQILIDGEISFVFERKTIDDLIASIKDGRYKNQKANLIESGFTTTQIYYIIEGNVKWSTNPKHSIDKTLFGAVINTCIRDKIGIFTTKNLEETFNLINLIFQRVQSEPKKYISSHEITKQIVTLSSNQKCTKEKCFLFQLCQIPEISEKTAEAIALKYKSMKDMITSLSSKSDQERLSEFCEIKTVDSKGKARKISSKAVTSLNEYLFF